MLLAVDVGNTKIKAAVFEGNALAERFSFSREEAVTGIGKIFSAYPGIVHSILTSVGKEDEGLLDCLKTKTSLTEINRDFKFPFENSYATPGTLGADRMVLAAGAVLHFPGQNRLVIDAGTCVTYDFIDVTDNYLGGAISPGLQLRYEAMHNFTAKLPLLYAEMPSGFVGNSTTQSMHSGVVNGLLYEIEGFMSRYEEKYGEVKIIMTGGDADFLAKSLKSTIFANSNFLLESLNELYLYTNLK